VQQRCTHVEIIREPVIEMSPHQGLGLEPEELVALERNLDGSIRFDKGRIDDRHNTHVVIDRVIGIFGKGNPTGGDYY